MATVSRILALPSATDYFPSPPSITGISYSASDFTSTQVRNNFNYQEPSSNWKNKSSALYKYRIEKNMGYGVPRLVVADTLLTYLTPTLLTTEIGVLHYIYPYTRSNGSDKDGTPVTFVPQKKPNLSPTILTSYITSNQIFVAWQAINSVSPNFSNNWGGAPENLAEYANTDREYEIIITSMPSGTLIANPTVSYTQTDYTFGGFFSGNYRVVVYAKNKAGYSTFTEASAVNLSVAPPPPPPPPFFCIQADTPIMVWLDNKITHKKAKEIVLGDRLVSYSFEELPKYESTYDVSTWSSDSFTPVSIESADVVSIKKHKKDKTIYINGDINTRMSVDHSVFIKNNDSTIITTAGLLEVGDTIFKFDNETMSVIEIKILSIDLIEEETDVFEIDCSPYDVFFAGDILTHNYKPPIY